jgi:hypothetical protein
MGDNNNLSLFVIEQSLQLLLDERLAAEEENDQEALAQIDKAIDEYFALEVRKVDKIAEAYRAYGAAATQADLEADRLHARAKQLHAVADRIKDRAKAAMEAFEVKRLETPLNRFRIQGNGGLQPMEITDPAALSDSVKTAVVTMPADDWKFIREGIVVGLAPSYRMAMGRAVESIEVNNARLREQLNWMIPCPKCKGSGTQTVTTEASTSVGTCERCSGGAMVKNHMEGARLLERGTQLRIE